MAFDTQHPKSKLQELELARAGEEELADIRHSRALTTDVREVKEGYFLSLQLIGALASISLSTTASYWGFSPAAAVIADINADIGMTIYTLVINSAHNLRQAQAQIQASLPLFGQLLLLFLSSSLVELPTNSVGDGF